MLGASFADQSDAGDSTRFKLLDPVNGKYYWPLREGDSDGKTFGSRMGAYPDAAPGVRHALRLYFPPVPAGATRLTVLTPGTTGEMTGIPVVTGAAKDAPVPRPKAAKAGTPHFFRVYPPAGKVWSAVTDLHDYVEGEQKTTSTGGGEEKIALRADVLFAFDKATPSSKATRVLDDAIEETRDRADPAKPPIDITGYTDSKGGDADNPKLSRRRADAVEKYVSGKLGGASYGAIVATGTAHRTRYYQVREGGFDHGLANFVNGEVGSVEGGADNGLYVYYRAPPAGVRKVDVTVGDRYTVRNVPIR